MTITHGLRGGRTIITERRDGGRVVSFGPHRGYVQHSFAWHGRPYVQRTYLMGGRTYVGVYRPYYYAGVPYYHYVPAFYYHPVFYGWAYNPWPQPVPYRWGWLGAPWYGRYDSYFAPYPVYPTAAFWLTDFLLAANLEASYEAQQAAAQQPVAYAAQPPVAYVEQPPPVAQNTAPVLTPEVKQAIADEVSAQLAAEQAAAARPAAPDSEPAAANDEVPQALSPQFRTFVVSSSLEVQNGADTCELTPGDILTRLDDTPGTDNAVQVMVSASKPEDCASGSKPRVQVSDLQEMYNQFHSQLDAGMKSLAESQGKGGLPSAPDVGTAAGSVTVPSPDASVQAALQEQQNAAEQTEADVRQSF